MESVRFQPNERVDVPDAQALGLLPLYEFRRMIRGLLLGEAENKIVNGFRTTATGPASAIVNVTLDPGGSAWLSHAIAAELVSLAGGGTNVDRGVLIGGENSYAELGGNATYPVDFTGAPNGNYIVEMRFTFIPGKNDNRVFINPGTHVEAPGTMNTRWIPALEVRRIPGTTPTAGGVWFPLSQIAWGGTSIVAGDITDRRIFAAEGAAPFQRAGWGASGGVADFDRSTDRANLGLNALYPLARAMMRQVQDMKGRAGGMLDWFARGAQPMRVGNGQLTAADQTKGIAESADTCIFTVGDGVSEWGDFNGATGLQECLSHIVSQKANLPAVVRIVLKRRAAAEALASGFAWALDTPANLANVSVIIDGTTGGGHIDGGGNICPQAPIDFTHTGNTTHYFTATTGATAARLTLINLATVLPGASKVVNPIANVRQLVVKGCKLTVSNVATRALRCMSIGSEIDDSTIEGIIDFWGGDATTGLATPYGRVTRLLGRTVDSSNTGQETIVRTSDSGSVPGHGLYIARSRFRRIDGGATSRVTVDDCQLIPGYEDAIRLGAVSNAGESEDWLIRNLRTTVVTDASGHSPGAGTNGSDGTGWAVYAAGTNTNSVCNRRIRIEGIHCMGAGAIDAGGVRIEDGSDISVRGLNMEEVNYQASAIASTGIVFENVRNAWIRECSYQGIAGGSASFVFTGVKLTGNAARDINIAENVFDLVSTWLNTSYTMDVDAATVRNISFHHNRCFRGNGIHVLVQTSTDIVGTYFEHNEFNPVVTAAIYFNTSLGTVRHVRVNHNMIESASTSTGAQLFRSQSGTDLSEVEFVGNSLVCPNTVSPSRGACTAFIVGAVRNLVCALNRVYGNAENGSGAATLLTVQGGGTGIQISGNTTDGNASGDRALRLSGMTGASVIMFHGNNLAGTAFSNDAGAAVWDEHNYVTGGVTP
jgi:hypothetical protein